MCRIAGIIESTHGQQHLKDHVLEMCNSMRNGGPDGEGVWQSEDNRVAFGSRRLALIDLSADANQPMHYGPQLTITFNGEIYNFPELKTELIALGCTFENESDTEVILAAYKQWGTKSFARLRGMFAFALYDHAIEKVYIVRDPVGIKPLYYSWINKRLTFASEVKAFSVSGKTYAEKKDWKVYFLAFGHIPEPFTTLTSVFSLTKGHYLELDLEAATLTKHRFFSFCYREKYLQKSIAEKKIYESLRKSVRGHLISDAPIGVFLSGGIDSSILTLLADESSRNLTTVSVSFNERTFSEKKYQNAITDMILGSHSKNTLGFKEFQENFDEAISAIDQPSIDGINTWFISKYAKENGLKAVLSGIGADEYFGGYPSFRRGFIVNLLSILPKFALVALSSLPFNIAKRSYFLTYKNLIGEYLFLRGLFPAKKIAELLNIELSHVDKLLSSLPVHFPEGISKHGKDKISWLEANFYLQNQLLKDTDSMSMSHGLEVRTPFLDIDFIQTCLHVKSSIRFDHKYKKRLLIDSFSGILPQRIWSRPKMGFVFPFSIWLKKITSFNRKERYQHNKAATDLFKDFDSGKLSWAKMLALYQSFDEQ